MGESTYCPANIDGAGRRQRFFGGVMGILVAATMTWLLAKLDVRNPWVQITVAAPLFFAMLGFLQAKGKTCVVLAARGERRIGNALQVVSDKNERSQLRKQSMGILWRSLVGTVVLTAISVLVQLFLRS